MTSFMVFRLTEHLHSVRVCDAAKQHFSPPSLAPQHTLNNHQLILGLAVGDVTLPWAPGDCRSSTEAARSQGQECAVQPPQEVPPQGPPLRDQARSEGRLDEKVFFHVCLLSRAGQAVG
jgi:hypothetical protein